MLYLGGLLGALLLLVWLFCIIDVIMTPSDEIRHLPKLVWLGLVIILGDLGSAAWLLAGRPWPGGSPLERALGRGAQPGPGAGSHYPEYDRPGRFAATNPDDDAEFLAQVRERAEAQRRTEAARRRERERAETEERESRERRKREAGEAGEADGTG